MIDDVPASLEDIARAKNLKSPPVIEPTIRKQMSVFSLTAHEENDFIYKPEKQNDPNFLELVESIRIDGIMNDIIIKPDGTIISGHRRWKAARLLGLPMVPVRVEIYEDADAELRALIFHNFQRKKKPSEMWQEGEALKRVLKKLGKIQGRTTKQIAEALGFRSSRQYERLDDIFRNAPSQVKKDLDAEKITISGAYNTLLALRQNSPEVQEVARAKIEQGEETAKALRTSRREVAAKAEPIVSDGILASDLLPEPKTSTAPIAKQVGVAEPPADPVQTYSGILIFPEYDIPQFKIQTPWRSSQGIVKLMQGQLGEAGNIRQILDADGLVFMFSFGPTLGMALNILKGWDMEAVDLLSNWSDKEKSKIGRIPQDATYFIVARRKHDPIPDLSHVKSNFMRNSAKNGASLENIHSPLMNLTMSFNDGPYLIVDGPAMPEQYLDEWTVIRS